MKNLLAILAALSGERARWLLSILAKLVFWLTMATFIYLLLGLILPVPAHAAEGAVSVKDLAGYQANTPPGDLSIKLWWSVLGDTLTKAVTGVGEPTTLLGRLLLIYNGAIFALGAAWVGYGVVRSMVNTAQEGEALGQSINTYWYPIKVVVGLGSSAPVLGGLTLLQGLLIVCALSGIGVANTMLKSTIEAKEVTQLVGTAGPALTGAPAVRPSQVVDTTIAMLRGNICMIGYAQIAQQFRELKTEPPGYVLITRTIDSPQPGSLRVRYGWSGSPEVCGSASIRLDKYREASSATSFRVSTVNYAGIRNSVGALAGQKLVAADDVMRGMAQAWMTVRNQQRAGQSIELSLDIDKLNEIAASYAGSIEALVTTSLANTGSSFTEAAQKRIMQDGWLGLGSYYSTFAEANAALADAVSGLSLSSRPPSEYVIQDVREDLDVFDSVVNTVKAHQIGVSGASADDKILSDAMRDSCPSAMGLSTSTTIGSCSLGQAIVNKLLSASFAGSGGGQSWASEWGLVNPVIALKNTGDYVMSLASTLIVASSVPGVDLLGKGLSMVGLASTATGIGAGAGGAAGMAGAVISHLSGLSWMLFAVGLLLAVYIPFLPWITFMSATVSYSASFIEALLAAPLHSLSHLHTDGDGLGQQTSRGYLAMLSVFIRPALMVISFFVASALVVAIGSIAAHMFAPAMASVQGNSLTGIGSIIGMLLVFAGVQIAIIQGCFLLITEITDRVIGYLGAGDGGQSMAQGAERAIYAAYQSAGRQGMDGAQASADAGHKHAKEARRNSGRGAAPGGAGQ